jgi:hypothetical protein
MLLMSVASQIAGRGLGMNMPTSHPSGYPCRYFGNPSDAFHKMGRRPGNDRSRRNPVVVARSGEGPFTIPFADLVVRVFVARRAQHRRMRPQRPSPVPEPQKLTHNLRAFWRIVAHALSRHSQLARYAVFVAIPGALRAGIKVNGRICRRAEMDYGRRRLRNIYWRGK